MFLFINFHVSFIVSCALAQPLLASALGLSGNSIQDVLVASALPSHWLFSILPHLRDMGNSVHSTITMTPSLPWEACYHLPAPFSAAPCVSLPNTHSSLTAGALPHSSLQSSCWNFWTPPPKYLPLTLASPSLVGPVASSPE